MIGTYIFREITDKTELEQFFRLRYKIYKDSRMKAFLKENAHGVDMDIYDLHSLHYGLFCEQKPVGYLRLVLYKTECYNSKVLELGKKFGVYTDSIHAYPAILQLSYPDFPFLNYPAVPHSMKLYYEDSLNKKTGFMEASRLVILPDFRQSLLTKYLIECAITIYATIFIHSKQGVINCIKRHETFYTQYGFSPIENSEGAYVIGDALTRLMLYYKSIPQYLFSLIETMANEFRNTGKMTMEYTEEAMSAKVCK
jgi:hypothetical protein